MIIKTPLADIVTTTYQGKILIKQNTLTVAMGLSKDISPTDSRLGKYINAFNAVTKIKSVRWLDAQKVVEGILPQFLNGYLGEIRGSPSRQQFCKNTPTFIFQNTKAVLDILKENFSMHNLKPIKTIITPNGTKLGVYKENGKLFYGISRLAKALGFSQFANDSTLGMAFKNKDFYCGFKQISGGSARVGDFDQIVPLLEYFIKLTLNITPNNSSQELVLDTARMEAQRLIELLTGKPTDTPKQSEPAPPKDDSRFKDRHSWKRCIAVCRLAPYDKLLGVYDFNGERYLFVDEIVAAICTDGDETSTRDKFITATKQALVCLSDANIDGEFAESKVVNVKDFFTVLELLKTYETPAKAKKIKMLMEDLRDNPYFVKPQQKGKTKPVVEAMNLFGEEPLAKTKTQSGIVTLAEPLKFAYVALAENEKKFNVYHDNNNHLYATFTKTYKAVFAVEGGGDFNALKRWLSKGIPAYRARANDRRFNTDDYMAYFVRLDEAAKVFPQIANWLKKDEVPTMTENNPAEKTMTIDDKEEMLIRELLNLRQEKFSRQIAGFDKQIEDTVNKISEIDAQVQLLQDKSFELEELTEKLKTERAEATDQFNRKQKLFEEMFS